MPAVCFYFQVHQPWRLQPYSYRQVGKSHHYFDEEKNREIFLKVAHKCYLPTNRKILELIHRFQGQFRVAYSITGLALKQMQRYCPEVLKTFQELAQTGCVEFLNETCHHSLSCLYDPMEFKHQILLHRELMEELFGVKPTVFRNTELIYNDEIGEIVADMGFKAILAEGADDILEWRSPNFVYQHPRADIKLLLKNYRLSDDIAFRFSNRSWSKWPLIATTFAKWVHRLSGNGEVVNLFMDYETFGEHQWQETGIFEFLDHLPGEILRHGDWQFKTPSEVLETYEPVSCLSYPRLVSWADLERDITAWNGNEMQKRALKEIYQLGLEVRRHNNPATSELWRKLQVSDHFYYMCTKWFSDGDVHAYFNPYKSPYEAFINYMYVLTDFRESILGLGSSTPTKLVA